jgi:hypothetical protein
MPDRGLQCQRALLSICSLDPAALASAKPPLNKQRLYSEFA